MTTLLRRQVVHVVSEVQGNLLDQSSFLHVLQLGLRNRDPVNPSLLAIERSPRSWIRVITEAATPTCTHAAWHLQYLHQHCSHDSTELPRPKAPTRINHHDLSRSRQSDQQASVIDHDGSLSTAQPLMRPELNPLSPSLSPNARGNRAKRYQIPLTVPERPNLRPLARPQIRSRKRGLPCQIQPSRGQASLSFLSAGAASATLSNDTACFSVSGLKDPAQNATPVGQKNDTVNPLRSLRAPVSTSQLPKLRCDTKRVPRVRPAQLYPRPFDTMKDCRDCTCAARED